ARIRRAHHFHQHARQNARSLRRLGAHRGVPDHTRLEDAASAARQVDDHGHRSANFFEIPSGPRNPVGVLWAGLSKVGIGMHGTNTPETIGRAASHGCIRLANWDAARFAYMITKGKA